MNEKLSRILMEIAINRGLVEIETKSKRGIRNLVDLGDHFSKGRFQKDFYNLAEKILANENSPYYELIFNTVENVDHNILKTFGINIGFNSWTSGANKIRQYKEEKGYNIPWTIIFDFEKSGEDKLNSSQISKLIQEGKTLGIYTYFFFLGDNIDKFKELVEIFKLEIDCAFILFANPSILEEKLVLELKNIGNTIISLNIRSTSSNYNQKMDLLKKNKILFGVHMTYYDEDTKFILDDNWIADIVKLNCTFAFLIPSSDCKKKNIELISKYVGYAKTSQKYPVFLIDFYEDLTHVDKIISEESCLMEILKDKTVILSCKDLLSKTKKR